MNGAADLGGMMGFGPVVPEPEDHRFDAEWQRRALALTLAMGAAGRWSIDEARHARESIPPPEYLTSSYYAIWVRALEDLLVAHGLVTRAELAAGRADGPGEPVRVLRAGDVRAALAAGTPYSRQVASPARFAAGQRVRARVMNPVGHTRLPRYVRGRIGTVVTVHAAHVLPDSNARGAGESPQWLYQVRFDARELWGEDADPASTVDVDAWESYLEPA
ncbi:nitrile hydratase subunit beta [Pseudonocardia dioxanivorans]|uniref:nitrile hydratase subunit beta n=1 Tax=Pseudonocardia dioxanivorans TaxID=240495 RepID=UPI000CD111CE|nr:nitrile hydratase subunit beta [Pseudonocardia dioxanivorans]